MVEGSKAPLSSAERLLLVGLLVFGLIAVSLAVFRLPTKLEAAISLERGRKAEVRGDWVTAERSYAEGLSRVPDSQELRARRGLALYFAKRGDDALETLSRVSTDVLPEHEAETVGAVLQSLIEARSQRRPRTGGRPQR